MRFILILMLLVPGISYGQKTLSRETFMVNVRPVLNGILGDFYQMIVLFPDFPRELIPVIQELDTLTSDKEILKDTCPRRIELKCQATLQSMRAKLAKLRSLSNVLMKEQKISSSPYINSISGYRLISEFDAELEEIKGQLDNTSYLLAAQIGQKKETYSVLKELDELNTVISLALVEYIPFTYREDFRHFYFNFVWPIQLQISKNKNYEFLNRNVNSLNFAINLLKMNLTKRNKKTPEGMGPFLEVIHNRWNSLLRYYF